ncbi:hypothetical protein [Gellertiella hungarica]|uniref:Flagellin N-methylase n=1 Tax=Gellertiella hungarica TaxID=1572859 RepID=A0A7W6J777_9HYPH|nr:hypothetical protein [Gellertiella hungarica]MBB4066091.1 hypothetical protein [Gellertiella hungarica]
MTPLDARDCAGCGLCCRLPDIDALDKPANEPCRHLAGEAGCRAYDTRPDTCRAFLCLWRTEAALGEEWHPPTAGMMVYRQGPQRTVLADPRRPDRSRSEPWLSQLRRWAAEDARTGGYVILFAGDRVEKIEPAPGGEA